MLWTRVVVIFLLSNLAFYLLMRLSFPQLVSMKEGLGFGLVLTSWVVFEMILVAGLLAGFLWFAVLKPARARALTLERLNQLRNQKP